jgi:hypothetical protein
MVPDILMPEVDGLELCRVFKNGTELPGMDDYSCYHNSVPFVCHGKNLV